MIRKMMFLLLLLSSVMMVQAAQPSGKTCYDPIPLGKDYAESVNSPCTKWYTARTFDLPIKVCFTPVNSSMPAPEVEMDFHCSHGNSGPFSDAQMGYSFFPKQDIHLIASNKQIYPLEFKKNQGM